MRSSVLGRSQPTCAILTRCRSHPQAVRGRRTVAAKVRKDHRRHRRVGHVLGKAGLLFEHDPSQEFVPERRDSRESEKGILPKSGVFQRAERNSAATPGEPWCK